MLSSSYLWIESDSVFAHFNNHLIIGHVPELSIFGGEWTYPVFSEMTAELWPINSLYISFHREKLTVSGTFSQRRIQK